MVMILAAVLPAAAVTLHSYALTVMIQDACYSNPTSYFLTFLLRKSSALPSKPQAAVNTSLPRVPYLHKLAVTRLPYPDTFIGKKTSLKMGSLWRGNFEESQFPPQSFWLSKTKILKNDEFSIPPLRNQQVTNAEFTALKWSLYKIFIGHSHNIEFPTYAVFCNKA